MPDFEQSLNSLDFGQLRIIAELWGIEFTTGDPKSAVKLLALTLLNPDFVAEIYESLAPSAKAALQEILVEGGKIPWAIFERRFGPLREVGSGGRDRQKIYLAPISPAEILWYRGLIARQFFDTPTAPQEFAYIPEDLMSFLPRTASVSAALPGRPALPVEYQDVYLAGDQILDHACTILACLRNRMSVRDIRLVPASWPGSDDEAVAFPHKLMPEVLIAILQNAGVIDASNQPDAELARDFLAMDRNHALALLSNQWRKNPDFNELRLHPGFILEGEWCNDPLQARAAILANLAQVPLNTWWSLASFVQSIKQRTPDFQRPAGDYDSWFIRDKRSGEFLRGVQNWEAVEGALIHFVIASVMHWLGIVDIARANPSSDVTAFRIRDNNSVLLKGEPTPANLAENETIHIQSNAQIIAPHLAPRTARYLLARFCRWDSEKKGTYYYRLTPASLERAREQDLTVEQLLSLLKKFSPAIPPNVAHALKRWENQGVEARVQSVVLLRLRSPELLQELRKSRAARFLGDPVGPTTIVLKPGSQQKVLEIMAELGYFGELID